MDNKILKEKYLQFTKERRAVNSKFKDLSKKIGGILEFQYV